MLPDQFGRYRPGDFWLAVEYHSAEQRRRDALMMETARGMAAHIVAPFIKGGIRDIQKFWPMPYDERPAAEVEMTEEERRKQIDDLKLLADKYLDGEKS